MKQRSAKTKPVPEQSDIVIDAEGRIHTSFVWSDAPDVVVTPIIADIAFPKASYANCKLCPKECGFDRAASAHPRCGDFQLRVATHGLSLGDEPLIRGTHGSGTVMLSGCPLQCPSCHNPEMVAHGTPHTIGEFVALCESLSRRGAHNIQILSPTVHAPALRAALRELKRREFPTPIVFKSSGYELAGVLQSFHGLVDIYLPDLKYGPGSLWAQRAGVPDYFEVASEAIFEMYRQVGDLKVNEQGIATRGVLVRHVKAPLPAKEFAELQRYFASLPVGVQVSITNNFTSLE